MEPMNYVAHRMLFDVCDLMTPIRDSYEEIYLYLAEKMELILNGVTRSVSLTRFSTWELVQRHVLTVFNDIILTMGVRDSIRTLCALFTGTYLLLSLYKSNSIFCSKIACCFYAVTQNFSCWRLIGNQ